MSIPGKEITSAVAYGKYKHGCMRGMWFCCVIRKQRYSLIWRSPRSFGRDRLSIIMADHPHRENAFKFTHTYTYEHTHMLLTNGLMLDTEQRINIGSTWS